MIIDHIGVYFIPYSFEYEIFRVIGRFAAPLFFFITGYLSHQHLKLTLLIYGAFLTLTDFYGERYLTSEIVYIDILINFFIIQWVLRKWEPSQSSLWVLVTLFSFLWTIDVLFTPLSAFSCTYLLEILNIESDCEAVILSYDTLGLAYACCGRLIATHYRKDIVGFFIIGTLFTQFIFYLEDYFWYEPFLFILLSGVTFLLFQIMLSFRKFSINFSMDSVLIFSRYSLEIYVLHLVAFKLIT
jgi:hypothetical protein